MDGLHQVVEGLGADDEVEGRGQGGPLVKVTHPQLGAGELPLHVGVVLHTHGEYHHERLEQDRKS